MRTTTVHETFLLLPPMEALNLFITQGILPATIVAFLCYSVLTRFINHRRLFSYWEKRGVRGPRPLFLLDKIVGFLPIDQTKKHVEYVQKYGKVYGTYEYNEPRLVIADPEIMRQICIKDFEVFQDHNSREDNEYQRSFLFFLKGDHWKRVRAMMTPTFTSGKIKRMFRLLDGCANDLVEHFEEQIKGSHKSAIVNAKDMYCSYTLATIATCCYGLKLNTTVSSEKTASVKNDLVQLLMNMFKVDHKRLFISRNFPLAMTVMNFFFPPEDGLGTLSKMMKQLIKNRRDAAKKFDDYLQLLVDARLHDEIELNETDIAENHHASLTQESLVADQRKLVEEVETRLPSSKVELSELEILSGAMLLLIVALETTGSLLTHCTYLLAFHPEIQQKLYNELLEIAEFDNSGDKSKFDYDSLTSCQYLDCVISETLRMVTSVLQVDRISNRDYRIEKYDIDLPKGSVVFLSLHGLMNDPDWWDEPTKFKPDRFMPGNREKIVPGSYCPFGIGPRHCIGMRFSLTEAKLALAKLIVRFRFEPAPNTSFPPELVTEYNMNSLKTPRVKVALRV